jgi:hypothetical protein
MSEDERFSGAVWRDPPVAARRFRHHRMGEVAGLAVDIAYPPGGSFDAAVTARPDCGNIPCVRWGEFARDRDNSREVWRRRERALPAVEHERSRTEADCLARASRFGGLTCQDQLGFQGAGSRVRVSVQR